MDIDYLLALQSFRDATDNALSPFMETLSTLIIPIPMILMFLVYWCASREAGKRIIFSFSLGMYVNGLLKLIACVYRPWIRDDRIIPYGDAKSGATGYSFPSGHTTYATTIIGGIGVWLRKKHVIIAVLCWVIVLLVMFSRNYLGVHTPQDVIVGLISSLIVMWIAWKIEAWTDKDPSRDRIIMVVGLVLCVATTIFYFVKPYPMDYLADGTLLVDPAKMRIDSMHGIALVSTYVICRYFERRGFNFQEEIPFKRRLVIGLVSLIPLIAWCVFGLKVLPSAIGSEAGHFVAFAGMVVYAMIAVPNAMRPFKPKKTASDQAQK